MEQGLNEDVDVEDEELVETVNQHHGVRLRHDLMDNRGRCAKGWSGLMFRNRALNGYELVRN